MPNYRRPPVFYFSGGFCNLKKAVGGEFTLHSSGKYLLAAEFCPLQGLFDCRQLFNTHRNYDARGLATHMNIMHASVSEDFKCQRSSVIEKLSEFRLLVGQAARAGQEMSTLPMGVGARRAFDPGLCVFGKPLCCLCRTISSWLGQLSYCVRH